MNLRDLATALRQKQAQEAADKANYTKERDALWESVKKSCFDYFTETVLSDMHKGKTQGFVDLGCYARNLIVKDGRYNINDFSGSFYFDYRLICNTFNYSHAPFDVANKIEYVDGDRLFDLQVSASYDTARVDWKITAL